MPSKTKKQSRASSRLSNHDYSASPQTSSVTSSADSDINEKDLLFYLQEASIRFPSLIGKSALIGSVINADSKSNRCTIWLSESSMVACSLPPGSVVSVSLAASGSRSANAFPLTSFLGEMTKHFEIELIDEIASEVGNHFALATVFPSLEVAKNGVILSSSLSYTMGCPASGSVIFVYPVGSQPLTGLLNRNNGPQNSKTDNFSIHICNDLFLELVPTAGIVKNNGDLRSKKNSLEEINGQSENCSSLSPKTPLCRPKISSSPSHQASARHEAASTLSYPDSTSVDLFDMKEALRNESTKQLLQGYATSELYSRALFRGNLVTIQLLSKFFFFRVVGMNKLVASIDRDLMEERNYSSVVDHFKDAFLVNHETKVHLCLPTSPPRNRGFTFARGENKHADTNIEYDVSKLGGLGEEYATLKDTISSSMKNTLLRFGLQTKGVLLHGPPGTGKTTLARLCVRDAGVNLFPVNGSEIFSQYHGESEQAMQKIFHLASQASPAVVFIDELDAVAPARTEGGEELSQRMVATLLNLMDGISKIDGTIVIAATNRLESIDPALRRPGRFEEIEIGVPSPTQRLDILQTILGEKKHSLSPMEIQQLALTTHGFVGADLAALCNEAALVCLRRHAWFKEICNSIHLKRLSVLHEDVSNSSQKRSDCLVGMKDFFRDLTNSESSNVTELPISMKISPSSFVGREISKKIQDTNIGSVEALFVDGDYNLAVSFEDFEKAKLKVRPSAMREAILEVPKVNWEDVGGQVEVKNQLKEAVLWSHEYKNALKRVGVGPPTGILMFGPPGCSKTMMARAVASETNLNFLAVKGPEVFSKWVGESEKAVRSIFAKARANAPSIIFFDEIDGLAVIRGKESDGVSVSDRVVSQLLIELDGLHQRVDVTVIAATNRPDMIDPALLRPGRFDRLLYVGPPNEIDREDIFRIHLRKFQCSSDVSIKELACLTEGYTGADISRICREAATAAIRDMVDASELDVSKVNVTMRHLKTAISQVEPSETQSYEELSNNFQRLVRTSDGGEKVKVRSSISHRGFQSGGPWSLIKTSLQLLFGILMRASKSTPDE